MALLMDSISGYSLRQESSAWSLFLPWFTASLDRDIVSSEKALNLWKRAFLWASWPVLSDFWAMPLLRIPLL